MISQSFPCGTVLEHYIANINPVFDEIVSHPYMLGPFTAGFHSVPFNHHGAEIIVENHAFIYSETLGLDKILGP